MRINHNIAALNTYNKLSANQASTSKSLEKLSSGLKINKAGDDAAGLAISEKMRGQIRGLDQASNNAADGISLIKTAEGALNETHSILQRMRELAVQASNDTNTTSDRSEIQKEIGQLTNEIDRIGGDTEFNTKKLLNGAANISGTSAVDGLTVVGGTGETKVGTSLTLTEAKKASSATGVRTMFTADIATADTSLSINGTTFKVAKDDTSADVIKRINAANLGVTATADATKLTLTSTATGSAATLDFDSTTAGSIVTSNGADASIKVTGETSVGHGDYVTITSGNAKGLELKVTLDDNDGGAVKVDSNGTVNLQIGANENQEMNISMKDMRADALGISSVDVTTQATAKSSITTIDDAITNVSSERAKLGSYQNRLEHTINNLGTSSENTAAAESRIRDVDMAKEMMEFTKNNILSQAAQAMLAQANQQPQGVLQLLQ